MMEYCFRCAYATVICVLLVAVVSFVIRINPELWLSGIGQCRVEAPKISMEEAFNRNRHPVCVLITGASSGLGQGIAQILSEYENVNLILTGRTKARAENAIRTKKPLLLASALELEDFKSIDAFVKEVKSVVSSSKCNGVLHYAYFNAGAIYSMGYEGPFHSLDGKNDKLVALNFIGTARLLQGLQSLLDSSNTRVVLVSSNGHYLINKEEHLLQPQPQSKHGNPYLQHQMYAASKFGMQVMYEKARERKMNILSMTPGVVDTNINHTPERRLSSDGRFAPYPFDRDGFFFSPICAAKFTILSSLLSLDQVSSKEFILPYFYGFERSWLLRNGPHALKLLISVLNEVIFQKVSHVENKLWVCPTSYRLEDREFVNKVVDKYLNWMK